MLLSVFAVKKYFFNTLKSLGTAEGFCVIFGKRKSYFPIDERNTQNTKKLGRTELFCVLHKCLVFYIFLHAAHIGEHFRSVAQNIYF